RISMISLLCFTRRLSPNGNRSDQAGRHLAVPGESRGHQRGRIWPPTGSIPRPPSLPSLAQALPTIPHATLRAALRRATPPSNWAQLDLLDDIEATSTPAVSTPREHATTRSPQGEYALDLAQQGFAVFPLVPGTKRPLIKDWPTKATTDPTQVSLWWREHPHANIGIACGPSHLYVIDLDAPKTSGGDAHGQQTL